MRVWRVTRRPDCRRGGGHGALRNIHQAQRAVTLRRAIELPRARTGRRMTPRVVASLAMSGEACGLSRSRRSLRARRCVDRIPPPVGIGRFIGSYSFAVNELVECLESPILLHDLPLPATDRVCQRPPFLPKKVL